MARRKRGARRIRTFDNAGHRLGGGQDEPMPYDWTTPGGASGSWEDDGLVTPIWAATDDNDILRAVVPNDTPVDLDVVAVRRDWPERGVTTWYKPTVTAIAAGRVQAAIDTLSATGAQIAEVGGNAIEALAGVMKNIFPILIGFAALYLYLQSKGN